MVIRPFTSADYRVISAIASLARPDTSITELRLREADKTREPHIKFGGLMAEVRSKGVGFIGHTQYADYYQSDKVVLFGTVLPDLRNRGAGSRLLSSLETQLPKIGVTEIQTQVSE